MKTIRCFAKYPGAPPEVVELTEMLRSYQNFVGGLIETCTFEHGWTVICNEDGRRLGLEHNCEILGVDFYGPILFVGVEVLEDGENGDEFCDMPVDFETFRKLWFPELWEQ